MPWFSLLASCPSYDTYLLSSFSIQSIRLSSVAFAAGCDCSTPRCEFRWYLCQACTPGHRQESRYNKHRFRRREGQREEDRGEEGTPRARRGPSHTRVIWSTRVCGIEHLSCRRTSQCSPEKRDLHITTANLGDMYTVGLYKAPRSASYAGHHRPRSQ